ncbi:hypothetical protein Tco_1210821 [Tanacetum coccineum]
MSLDYTHKAIRSLTYSFPDGSKAIHIDTALKELCIEWPPRVTLGRLLPHARGLGFKPRRGGFPSGAKKEWGLSPKAKVKGGEGWGGGCYGGKVGEGEGGVSE